MRASHYPFTPWRPEAWLSLTLPIYPITPSRPTFTPITPNDAKNLLRAAPQRGHMTVKQVVNNELDPKVGAGWSLRAHSCRKTLVGGVADVLGTCV